MRNFVGAHAANNNKRSSQFLSSPDSDEEQQRWKRQAIPIESEDSQTVGVANATLFSPQLVQGQGFSHQRFQDQHLQRPTTQPASSSESPPPDASMHNPGTIHSPRDALPPEDPQSWKVIAESWMWDDEHLFLQPATTQTDPPPSHISSQGNHATVGHFQQETPSNCPAGPVADSHQRLVPANGFSDTVTGQLDGGSIMQKRATGMGPNHQKLSSSQVRGPVYMLSHQQNGNLFSTDEEPPSNCPAGPVVQYFHRVLTSASLSTPSFVDIVMS